MAKVICITAGKRVAEEVSELAFSFWLARRFRKGSPEKDFLRAVLEVTFRPGGQARRKRTPAPEIPRNLAAPMRE
jgi:hypothetical protein